MTKIQAVNKLRKSGFFHSEASTVGWVEEAFKHNPQFKKAITDDLNLNKIGEETVEVTLYDHNILETITIDEFRILTD